MKSIHPNPLLVPVLNPDFVWDEIVDVLDDYFRIRHEERVRQLGNVLVEGRVDTFPAIGSTYLEPWRTDSATPYEKLESSLQSIRRFAVVRVIPDSRGYLVSVAVMKELEDLSNPEFATAGAATFRHDGSLDRYSDPILAGSRTLGWIPVGRDPALEQELLEKLHARLILGCVDVQAR